MLVYDAGTPRSRRATWPEIRVDDVRCHQWLTNQIAEAPLHWRHEPSSIHQVSVADTSCGKPSVYSCRRPRGSMFLYLRAEQIDLISAWYGYTLVVILRELQFHTLCREFITEHASPILRRTSGREPLELCFLPM